jgi:hypothetical protein
MQALAVLAVFLCGGVAWAQTITLPTPSGSFRTASGRSGTTEVIYGLSRADCEADLVYNFSSIISGWSTGEFQVWASNTADCKSKDARTATTNRQCWQVTTPKPAFFNGTLAVPIKGRDLVAYVGQTPPDDYTPADSSVCTNQSGTAAVKVTLYFLIVDSSSKEALGTGASYGISTDLLAPTAPAISGLEVQNQALKVTWGTSTDTDILTYEVCRDQGVAVATAGVVAAETPEAAGLGVGGSVCAAIGSTSSTDAGADAGADAAIADGDAETPDATDAAAADAETTDAAADSASAADASGSDGGALPDESSDLVCESASKGATSYTFSGLENDKVYTFVLRAKDTLGNQGDVGTAACQYPSATTTFYDGYTGAGGQAGGGFCSMGRGSLTGVTGFAIAMGGVAGLALLRRRRRS